MSGGRARGHLGEWGSRVEGQLEKTEPGSLLNQAAAAHMADGPARGAAKRRRVFDWGADTPNITCGVKLCALSACANHRASLSLLDGRAGLGR